MYRHQQVRYTILGFCVRLPVLLSRVHVAAKKLVEKKDLKQLSDQLREMKEDAFSKTVAGLSLSFFF